MYARHHAGDWVMYDLKNDPFELHNLIDDPDHAAQKQALQQEFSALRIELGESTPLVGVDPDPFPLPDASGGGG